jgi:hypothetical protein
LGVSMRDPGTTRSRTVPAALAMSQYIINRLRLERV